MRVVALTREQQAAEFVLHLLDRAGQRGLADIADLGRPGEVQRLAECQEVTDFMQFHDAPRVPDALSLFPVTRYTAVPPIAGAYRLHRHSALAMPAPDRQVSPHQQEGNRTMDTIMASAGLARSGNPRPMDGKVAVV